MATANGAYRKKKNGELKESKAGDLLTKVDKKCSSRLTKSILTEQAEHSQTSQPTWRQTRGRNCAEKTNRHRAPIAPRGGRYLRVTAVNHTKPDQDQPQKLTKPGPTACTHPTTNTTLTTTVATRGTRKTRTSIPPSAASRGPTHRAKLKKPSSQAPTSIAVPDVVAEAVQCPREAVGSQPSSLSVANSVTVVKEDLENQPQTKDALDQAQVEGKDVPQQLERTDVRDPDAGTESDPFQCGEYIKDIYSYLLDLEARSVYAIREDFMSNQVEVRTQHRNILVDWLVQVQQRFVLLPETLYLTINILDRSLQVVRTTKDDLQLLGVTAMLIASKFEEIYPPSIGEFSYITADAYSEERIRKMEVVLLKKMDFQFNNPSVILFLRRYSKLMETNKKVHNLAKYILELSLLEPANSSIPSSKKAGAALLLAASLLNPKDPLQKLWCATLVVYSTYEVRHLRDTKTRLKKSLYDGHHDEKLKAIRDKYATSDFMEVSTLRVLDKEN